MEKLGPGRWRVNGTMRLDDFRREYPALGDVPEVETMGGLLMHLLGRGAEPGRIGDVSRVEADGAGDGRAARARAAGGGGEMNHETLNLLNWACPRRLPGAVVPAVGHGGGRVCAEPAAHPAADARGPASAKLLHGYLENPENFLWTILVGNTVVNFVILGWLRVRLYDGLQPTSSVVCRCRLSVIVFLFYALFDLLPKMLFRDVSEPAVPVAGACRSGSFICCCVRWSGPVECVSRRYCSAWTGGKAFTRPSVRQPRGTALAHAGIRAGLHHGGARDDQPRARSAEPDRAADHEAVGAGGDGDEANRRCVTRWRCAANAPSRACRSGKRATDSGASAAS